MSRQVLARFGGEPIAGLYFHADFLLSVCSVTSVVQGLVYWPCKSFPIWA